MTEVLIACAALAVMAFLGDIDPGPRSDVGWTIMRDDELSGDGEKR